MRYTSAIAQTMSDTQTTPEQIYSATLENTALTPTKVRWVVLFLISLMYLLTYMDRSNISVAAPAIAKEFGLSKTAMGFVFSAFLWAYAIGQIPGGWLGDRFGPRRVLLSIIPFWSVTVIFTGLTTGVASLGVTRFVLGLSEAGAFPIATRGMQLWFPKSERGIVHGVTHFFSRFAVAATPFVAVSIMVAFGWRTIFYIFGSVGFVWSAVFFVFLPQSPGRTQRRQSSGTGSHPRPPRRWLDQPIGGSKIAPGGAVEKYFQFAQYVVHRGRLRLLLLRHLFFPHLVSHLSSRIPPFVACSRLALSPLSLCCSGWWAISREVP